MKAPLPTNERERLAVLRKYEILDTSPEIAYDRVTRLASRLFGAPIALVSLVDEHRQWFKSACGLEVSETERDLAFCAHTILGNSVLCVPNTKEDSRFRDNALVKGDPYIRFYAGAPLRDRDGWNLGTLCVIDHVARAPLSPEENETLEDLAAIVMAELQLRVITRSLSAMNEELSRLATTDPLTLLPNRLAFERQLERRLLDKPETSCTVMYLDLDGFKAVNDGPGGHAAGDELLQILTAILAGCLPPDAMLARFGGDEFTALISGLSLWEAEQLANRMCQALDRQVVISDGKSYQCGVSIGVAVFPHDAASAMELVRQSDRAMYKAKQGGGHCYRMAAQSTGFTETRGLN